MRRKGLEWRSKKYAPVQNVSVVNGYMDAEDFRQKYKTGRVGVKKRMSPAAGGQNHIMIYGPKSDGTYVVEERRVIAVICVPFELPSQSRSYCTNCPD